jgi:hypothetical protein
MKLDRHLSKQGRGLFLRFQTVRDWGRCGDIPFSLLQLVDELTTEPVGYGHIKMSRRFTPRAACANYYPQCQLMLSNAGTTTTDSWDMDKSDSVGIY